MFRCVYPKQDVRMFPNEDAHPRIIRPVIDTITKIIENIIFVWQNFFSLLSLHFSSCLNPQNFIYIYIYIF